MPAGPTPEELALFADGAKIRNLMPYISREVAAMKKAVETRVYTAIAQGTFTPEHAHTAWLELNAYDRLLKRLETHVKIGLDAGTKLGEQ